MLEELLPTGLNDAARRLGVTPLEVVRLMVASDSVTPGFSATADHLRKLAEIGQIEGGWWEGAELPTDENASRQRVRAAVGLLLGRAASGPIRMDNLWRGLAPADQQLVAEAMDILGFEDKVDIQSANCGITIGVRSDQREFLAALASGDAESPGLNELYQG